MENLSFAILAFAEAGFKLPPAKYAAVALHLVSPCIALFVTSDLQ